MSDDERAEALQCAIEVTSTKSIPPIEDAFDAAFVSVPRNAWLSAVAVACFYRADHPVPGPTPPAGQPPLTDAFRAAADIEAATPITVGQPRAGERYLQTDGRTWTVWEPWPDYELNPDGKVMRARAIAKNLNQADAELLAHGRAELERYRGAITDMLEELALPPYKLRISTYETALALASRAG